MHHSNLKTIKTIIYHLSKIVHLDLASYYLLCQDKTIIHTSETVPPDEEFHRKIVLASSTLHGIWRQLHLPAIIEHFELKASI